MRIKYLVFTAALLAAAPLAAKPAKKPAGDAGIVVGQIVDDALGKTVSGWLYAQGSMYPVMSGAGQAAGDAYACCVAVFQKGRRYAVARTEALTRNPDGGVIKERVIAVSRITALPGEGETICEGSSRYFALSLKNERTGMVRSIAVSQAGELSLVQWKDSKGLCGSGE